LDDGNIYRKALYLMVKTCKNHGFRLRFSQQNQSIDHLITSQEMSVMADYSVELSTELDEKCDFVEAVRPVRRGMAPWTGRKRWWGVAKRLVRFGNRDRFDMI